MKYEMSRPLFQDPGEDGARQGWIRGAILSTMQPVVTFRRWWWGTVAGLVAAPAAFAWVAYRSESGAVLRWTEPDVVIALSPPPGALDRGATRAALDWGVAQWAELDCDGPVVTIREVGATVLDAEDAQSSVVWIDDVAVWNQRFSATELARTILIYRVQSGRMVDADIAVNLGGFDFSASESCDAERYDLWMTLTHELGHFFGLDHSLADGATMQAKASPGECQGRSLSPDDREGYCSSYDVPTPVEPEPGPEVADVVEAADMGDVSEAEADGARRDDGCCGAGGLSGAGAWMLVGLGTALVRGLRRGARRAT